MMRCIEGFVARYQGEDVLVNVGEVADADHELVKRVPHCWEPLKGRFMVEQATAAPGEARPARVRTKAPADAPDA